MRKTEHPGAPEPPRRIVLTGRAARDFRVVVPEGSDLLAGLSETLIAAGVRHAAIRLVRGTFSSLSYRTWRADESGARVAAYGLPVPVEGGATLLGGAAVLGQANNGGAAMHCRAIVADGDGDVQGGYLPHGLCIVGPGGVVAEVSALSDVGFGEYRDAETDSDLFQPVETTP
jgi:hypothetical protein